jgi:hypothetical protein
MDSIPRFPQFLMDSRLIQWLVGEEVEIDRCTMAAA